MNSRLVKRAERVINMWQKLQENYYPMKDRCGAKKRNGDPCQKFRRCRLHGGRSLSGCNHGRYNSGQFTKEAFYKRKKDLCISSCCGARLKGGDTRQSPSITSRGRFWPMKRSIFER